MQQNSQKRRAAVRCSSCHSVFSAEIDDDGETLLIGVGTSCSCGSTDFRALG